MYSYILKKNSILNKLSRASTVTYKRIPFWINFYGPIDLRQGTENQQDSHLVDVNSVNCKFESTFECSQRFMC